MLVYVECACCVGLLQSHTFLDGSYFRTFEKESAFEKFCPTVCIMHGQFGNQRAHRLDVVQFAFITDCSQNRLSTVHFNGELRYFLVTMCFNRQPVEQFPFVTV